MDRTIKFRAWDKEEKRMINADSFYFSDQFEPFVDSVKSAQKRFEIMQFTGLYDKNGKEIYEGDIVQYKSYKYEVVYRQDICAFELVKPEFPAVLNIKTCKLIQVVGNIWEQKTTAE